MTDPNARALPTAHANTHSLAPLSALPGTTTAAASSAVFVGTLVAIVALVVALLVFDLFLAGIERRDSAAHALAEYGDGMALLGRDHPSEAVDRFAAAVAVDRTNQRYALALAQALLAAGRVRESESTLRVLLDRAGNDGAVNLAMARAMMREGRDDEATSYFHRAIFGRWGADSLARRSAARFELIESLERRGRTHELLAELLPLAETPPDSEALRKRVGLLFVRAGSPARGVAMLRDALRRDPDDGEVYGGLGEAALALGNFVTARADFAQAIRLRPNDARLAARAALVGEVVAISPLERGIGAHVRYERSRALLARTVDVTARCAGMSAMAADSARSALAAPVKRADEDDAGEVLVARATKLWAARPASCAPAGAGDEALSIVQERLRQ